MLRACLLSCIWLILGAASAAAQSADGTPHFVPPGATPDLTGPTPDQLMGFRFGASAGATARACRRAGHRYEPQADGSAICHGGVSPRELPAQVELVYCEGRLCEARATIRDAAARVGTYARALRALRSAFGAPPQRRLRVDHVCLGELVAGRSDRCLDAEGAGVRHWWEVSGTEIFLSLERGPKGPALIVSYRTPARLRAISLSSD